MEERSKKELTKEEKVLGNLSLTEAETQYLDALKEYSLYLEKLKVLAE